MISAWDSFRRGGKASTSSAPEKKQEPAAPLSESGQMWAKLDKNALSSGSVAEASTSKDDKSESTSQGAATTGKKRLVLGRGKPRK